MLVLSRKEGQKLLIGDISIEVTQIKPGRVKLGIIAGRSVQIVRAELLERSEAQKTEAAR